LEEVERLAAQSADEIYNEFDFTDPSSAETAPLTFSYGELPAPNASLDFGLQSLGEASRNLSKFGIGNGFSPARRL
jgi:hypothetical protein